MSRASENANAVMYAVEQVLDLYGVQHTREQSRVINVQDDRRPGGFRPMYFGKWIDNNGTVHSSGRADILARPIVRNDTVSNFSYTTPLWIECKAGKGRMNPDQHAFRSWVESNGDTYLLIRDDVQPLLDWLDAHGVKKEPKRVIHEAPMTQADVSKLQCRHCGEPEAAHLNKIRACAKKSALGKVWSPKL